MDEKDGQDQEEETGEVELFCLTLLQACNDMEKGYEKVDQYDKADMLMTLGVLIEECLRRMYGNGYEGAGVGGVLQEEPALSDG